MSKNKSMTQAAVPNPNTLLTVEETAALLKMDPGTIYNGTGPKAKRPFPIKPKRIGRLIRFPLSRVMDYINDEG